MYGAGPVPATMACGLSLPWRDNEFSQPTSVMCCHPEPFACAQGKLREGSLAMGREMLSVMIPLRGLITELRSA